MTQEVQQAYDRYKAATEAHTGLIRRALEIGSVDTSDLTAHAIEIEKNKEQITELLDFAEYRKAKRGGAQ